MSRKIQIKPTYEQCIWCSVHKTIDTIPAHGSRIPRKERNQLGLTISPSVMQCIMTMVTLIGQDDVAASEEKFDVSITRLLEVISQLQVSAVNGEATYRLLIDTIRKIVNNNPLTWLNFTYLLREALQTHKGNKILWQAELVCARPYHEESVEEFLWRAVCLRGLLIHIPDLFFHNDSIFANMLLHQIMASKKHFQQLMKMNFHSENNPSTITDERKLSAPNPEPLTLGSLDKDHNSTVCQFLDEFSVYILTGNQVDNDGIFSDSLLTRPQSQVGLEEIQKKIRAEIRLLKGVIQMGMIILGSPNTQSQPAGRDDMKTYCISCGTGLHVTAQGKSVVTAIISSGGLPKSPYARLAEERIKIEQEKKEAEAAALMASQPSLRARTNTENHKYSDALSNESKSRERKPVPSFKPYNGRGRTVDEDSDPSDNDGRRFPRSSRISATGKSDGVVRKPVCQINMDNGQIINTFESGSKAHKVLGIHQNSISRCCKGKAFTGGGWGWRFLSDLSKTEIKTRKVFLDQDEPIDEEDDLAGIAAAIKRADEACRMAVRAINSKLASLSAEMSSLNKKRAAIVKKNALNGEKAEFVYNKKRIQQVDRETGEVVGEFLSGVEAANVSGVPRTTISACCRGIIAVAGGFVWRFTDGDKDKKRDEEVEQNADVVPIDQDIKALKVLMAKIQSSKRKFANRFGGTGGQLQDDEADVNESEEEEEEEEEENGINPRPRSDSESPSSEFTHISKYNDKNDTIKELAFSTHRSGGRGNSIDQIDPSTMKVIAHFATGVEASMKTGVQRTIISRACHRTGGSEIGLANGYIWNFSDADYENDAEETRDSENDSENDESRSGLHKAIVELESNGSQTTNSLKRKLDSTSDSDAFSKRTFAGTSD